MIPADPSSRLTPESFIKTIAKEIGFSRVGFSDLSLPVESSAAFEKWLERGMHGEMHYLLRHKTACQDLCSLLEGARSVICVALDYYTELAGFLGSGKAGKKRRGAFSIYSRRKDYHKVLGTLLEKLEKRLKNAFPGAKSLLCVDTKPVPERSLAVNAGLGWLGKNTCVVSPQHGSWIFLGEIITDLDLRPDEPLETQCGDCTLCMEACPTKALVAPFVLDARRCISYLTVEKKGGIPREFHEGMGLRVFGCDECQLICPFNANALPSPIFKEEKENPIVGMELPEIVEMGDEKFFSLTKESVIRRCGAEGLRRNARIALENLRGD